MGYGHLAYLEDLVMSIKDNERTIPMQVPESTNALELVHALYASVEEIGGLKLTKIKDLNF